MTLLFLPNTFHQFPVSTFSGPAVDKQNIVYTKHTGQLKTATLCGHKSIHQLPTLTAAPQNNSIVIIILCTTDFEWDTSLQGTEKCQCLPWCGGGRTLTLPPGPAVEFGGREPTAIPDKRWARFTPPATGGIRLGAPVFGDAIPRASYARLMSEGEGFGWLFGAWLGTVMTEDINANKCRQQQIQMNTSESIHTNAKHCRNTCCTLTYILQLKYYITNPTECLYLKLHRKTETVSSCWYFGTQYSNDKLPNEVKS